MIFDSPPPLFVYVHSSRHRLIEAYAVQLAFSVPKPLLNLENHDSK